MKRPGREANHSPPSSAEVKNGEAVPPLPIFLHGMVLNSMFKYGDNFTFAFAEVPA
jgi:hypothetical protein